MNTVQAEGYNPNVRYDSIRPGQPELDDPEKLAEQVTDGETWQDILDELERLRPVMRITAQLVTR
jgi:hypothetical protein